MDEVGSSQPLIDSAGSNTLGPRSNFPGSGVGIIDGCRTFGGRPASQDAFGAPDAGLVNAFLNHQFTVMGWINAQGNAPGYDQNFLSLIGPSGAVFGSGFGTDMRYSCYWQDSSNVFTFLTSPNPFPSSGWHHLGWTYDGAKTTLYLDGSQQTQATQNGPASPGGAGYALDFGRYADLFNIDFLFADADDWNVSNVCFTAAQVFNDYQRGTGISTPPAPPPVFIPNPLSGLSLPTDFGMDIDCFDDLNPLMQLVGGFQNLGQALAHRLSTPRGTLPYDLNYGTDIRAFLNAAITPNQAAQIRSVVQGECTKDERVQTCQCSSTFDFQSSTLTLTLNVNTSSGPFIYVLAATKVSVELLKQLSA